MFMFKLMKIAQKYPFVIIMFVKKCLQKEDTKRKQKNETIQKRKRNLQKRKRKIQKRKKKMLD
jgi:hypothetical protein